MNSIVEKINALIENNNGDNEIKDKLLFIKYLFIDISENGYKKELLDTMMEKWISLVQLSENKIDRTNITIIDSKNNNYYLEKFKKYLLQPTGKNNKCLSDLTAYDYTRRLSKVCERSNINLEILYKDKNGLIEKLIEQYTNGEYKTLNLKQNRAPEAALKRFKEFIKVNKI